MSGERRRSFEQDANSRTPRRMRSENQPKSSSVKKKRSNSNPRPDIVQSERPRKGSSPKTPTPLQASRASSTGVAGSTNLQFMGNGASGGPRDSSKSESESGGATPNGPTPNGSSTDLNNIQLPNPKTKGRKEKKRKKRISIQTAPAPEEGVQVQFEGVGKVPVSLPTSVQQVPSLLPPPSAAVPISQKSKPSSGSSSLSGSPLLYDLPVIMPGGILSPVSTEPGQGVEPTYDGEMYQAELLSMKVENGGTDSPKSNDSPEAIDQNADPPEFSSQNMYEKVQAPIATKPPHKSVRFHRSPNFGGLLGNDATSVPYLNVAPTPPPGASVPVDSSLVFTSAKVAPLPLDPSDLASPPATSITSSAPAEKYLAGAQKSVQLHADASKSAEEERIRQAREKLEMEQRVFKRQQLRLQEECNALEEQRRTFEMQLHDFQLSMREAKHGAEEKYGGGNGKGGSDTSSSLAEAALSPQSNFSAEHTIASNGSSSIAEEQKTKLFKAMRDLNTVPDLLRPPPLLSNGEVDEESCARYQCYQPAQLLVPAQKCSASRSCNGAACAVLCAQDIEKTRAALILLQKVVATAFIQQKQMQEEFDADRPSESPKSVNSSGRTHGALLTPIGSPVGTPDKPSTEIAKSLSAGAIVGHQSQMMYGGHARARSTFWLPGSQDQVPPRVGRFSSMSSVGPGHMRRATTGSFMFRSLSASNLQDPDAGLGTISFEGYLYKKASRRLVVPWQQRYFVLYPSMLTYSEKKGGVTLSRIPIKFLKYITVPDQAKAPTILKMMAEVPRWGKKEYLLKAETSEDAERWSQEVWKALEAYGKQPVPETFILPDRRRSQAIDFKNVVVGSAALALTESELGPAESFYRPPATETEPQGALLLSGHIKMKNAGFMGGWVPLQAELRQNRLIFYRESAKKPQDSFTLLSLSAVFRDEKQPTDFTVVKDPSIGGGSLVLRGTDAPIAEKWVKELLYSIQDAREMAELKVRTRAVLQGPLTLGGGGISLPYLTMRPDDTLGRRFQTRWFQLFNNTLVYFRTSDVRVQPLRSYPLEDISAVWSDEKNLCVFSLVVSHHQGPAKGLTQGPARVVEASDPDTCLEWINNLRNQIFKNKLLCNGLSGYKFPSERSRGGNVADLARKNNLPASHDASMMVSFQEYPFFLPNDQEYVTINEQVTTGETCLKLARIDKLIEWITLAHEDHFNTRFDFLMTYTSFMTPKELADKLKTRACMPLEVPGSSTDKQAQNEWRLNEVAAVQRRVLLTVQGWMNLLTFEDQFAHMPSDSREGGAKKIEGKGLEAEGKVESELPEAVDMAAVLEKLLSDLASCAVTELLLQLIKGMQKDLRARVSQQRGRAQKSETLAGPGSGQGPMLQSFARTQTRKSPPQSILASKLPLQKQQFDFDQENVTELARQLAIRDFCLFSKIRCQEFIHRAWQSPHKNVLAPNVVKTTTHFNALVAWAQELVLPPDSTARIRAQRVSKLIKVAEKCQLIRAYPSFFALFTALTSEQCEVSRLTQTWALVPRGARSTFDAFHKIFNVERNHRAFRTELGRAKRPCVPFIGIFLSDLFQVDENMKDKTDGMVNFHKMRLLARTIGYLKQFQVEHFHYQSVPHIQAHFDSALTKTLAEDELMNRSKQLEPEC
eukprot:gb/GEZN01000272.1/.p1 GENE.gb/GEZN01000272.1/~~gb/GEZN01000272.1/.p1  ORF type:complete len:1635 (-),score=300.46 gb/GEZN01000272.1/:252-5156(-)